jgi:hypothetical protein
MILYEYLADLCLGFTCNAKVHPLSAERRNLSGFKEPKRTHTCGELRKKYREENHLKWLGAQVEGSWRGR